ncbi:MAG: ribosome biogenesis GTPase Der [Planctomycetia bacterium]|nr:ribosome biogenesis GTPase Der [Planctomycetia bacterium]
MVPRVVVVGRPNVGKSSLFNWLVEKRIAIEDPTAGVTRDRLVQRVELEGRVFDLVDTGGMGFDDPDGLTAQIDAQIEAGLAGATLVLLVVEVRSGLLPADREVAARVRRTAAPVLVVANKADDPKQDVIAHEFDELGFGPPVVVSVRQNRNRDGLVEEIVERLPEAWPEEPLAAALPEMKVAIVGRRNVGKSTFVNALAREERVITSPVAGTTRDSVDVRFEVDGHSFLAIDTPGLRRTKSRRSDLDFYSTHRAQRSIRRADVVLLFFDASEPIGKVDKQLAETVVEDSKPVVLVVNKWDLYAGGVERKEWVTYLRETFRTMPWAPVEFVTAKNGRNVKALIDTAQRLFRQSRSRVPTARLNAILRRAIDANPPPADGRGRPVRVYYATQVETAPPTIVLSTSGPRSVTEAYRRYLIGALRKESPFREVPIRLLVRGRAAGDERDRGKRGGAGDERDA